MKVLNKDAVTNKLVLEISLDELAQLTTIVGYASAAAQSRKQKLVVALIERFAKALVAATDGISVDVKGGGKDGKIMGTETRH
jgi:hypothetical protein